MRQQSLTYKVDQLVRSSPVTSTSIPASPREVPSPPKVPSPPEVPNLADLAGNYHGSGAGKVRDPSAPAMDAAAAGAASAVADAPAAVEEYLLSDDSLTVSPEQPKRARTRSRDDSLDFASPRSSRSPTTARSAHRKGPSLAAARVSSKFRAASAPRGAGRPPSPTPLKATLRDHRLVDRAEDSKDVEQRLAALERQQQDDHGFLAEMAVVVRGLLAG